MSEHDPQSGTPDGDPPTRPTDRSPGTATSPSGPPTRWQRTTRPSGWTRRTAIVVAGVVGLLLGVLLAGGVLAATAGGGHGDGPRDRGPGTSAEGRGGPGGPGAPGRPPGPDGGPRGERGGAAGASGPIVVQVQPGATVQVAPGATVQTVPGAQAQPGQPAEPAQPAQPAQPGQPGPARPARPARAAGSARSRAGLIVLERRRGGGHSGEADRCPPPRRRVRISSCPTRGWSWCAARTSTSSVSPRPGVASPAADRPRLVRSRVRPRPGLHTPGARVRGLAPAHHRGILCARSCSSPWPD